MGILNRQCVVCLQPLKLYFNTPHKRFCSAKRQQVDFHKRHPERRKVYNRRWQTRHPKHCKVCGVAIQRGSNHQLCSVCVPIRYQERTRRHRSKVSMAFMQYKEGRGCSQCGYNRYGGSLDFHHTNDKQSRIMAQDWYSNNSVWKVESEKCVLLCKNCHYELKKRAENGDI